jgi:hypothetical protein
MFEEKWHKIRNGYAFVSLQYWMFWPPLRLLVYHHVLYSLELIWCYFSLIPQILTGPQSPNLSDRRTNFLDELHFANWIFKWYSAATEYHGQPYLESRHRVHWTRIFGRFKHKTGKSIATNADVKQGVTSWLRTLNIDFFYNVIWSLLQSRDKCLNVNGD